jgi:redox-regulated HSP33 family molecular chaperone
MNNDSTNSKLPTEAEQPPRPTYAPVAMAMGIAMTTWGLMTFSLTTNSLTFMSVMGAGLVAWALWDWMHEVSIEWKNSDWQNTQRRSQE